MGCQLGTPKPLCSPSVPSSPSPPSLAHPRHTAGLCLLWRLLILDALVLSAPTFASAALTSAMLRWDATVVHAPWGRTALPRWPECLLGGTNALSTGLGGATSGARPGPGPAHGCLQASPRVPL